MANKETQEIKFNIKRIYVKDSSFESPQSPKIFEDATSSPKIGFNLNSDINKISETFYEIIVTINVKAESGGKIIYLAEVKQAGTFNIENAPKEILQKLLNVNCLEAIYPFARENISNLIQKGGFPPMYIAPVDFNSLFHEELEKRKNKN